MDAVIKSGQCRSRLLIYFMEIIDYEEWLFERRKIPIQLLLEE